MNKLLNVMLCVSRRILNIEKLSNSVSLVLHVKDWIYSGVLRFHGRELRQLRVAFDNSLTRCEDMFKLQAQVFSKLMFKLGRVCTRFRVTKAVNVYVVHVHCSLAHGNQKVMCLSSKNRSF